jgi:hypothetical protein
VLIAAAVGGVRLIDNAAIDVVPADVRCSAAKRLG